MQAISGASACCLNESKRFEDGQASFLLNDFTLDAFISFAITFPTSQFV